MPSIAIIDDRKDKRETMHRVVGSTLKKMKDADDWSVVSDDPPSDEREILQWLDLNDAAVLISDWKLNEGAQGKRVVRYQADSLINEIRRKRPTFPIFVVTGFEQEAKSYFQEVENIFGRSNFTKDVGRILPQILRAGRRRYEEQRGLLGRMDTLARKVASGRGSAKDRSELNQLQGYFQAELPAIISLDTVLTEFEKAQKRADALRDKVERRIKKGKEAN